MSEPGTEWGAVLAEIGAEREDPAYSAGIEQIENEPEVVAHSAGFENVPEAEA